MFGLVAPILGSRAKVKEKSLKPRLISSYRPWGMQSAMEHLPMCS